MALIAYLMEKKDNYGPHLIIVPNAVMVNWKAELTQWLPSVRCVYYVGHKVPCLLLPIHCLWIVLGPTALCCSFGWPMRNL